MAKKTETTQTSINNLKFILGKVKPVAAKVKELRRELDPLEEQLERLQKSAKTAAVEVWDEAVTKTANEWKSAHGDEEVSIEWVDERYSKIPPEAFEAFDYDVSYSRRSEDHPRDLLAFFDEVSVVVEGEKEDD